MRKMGTKKRSRVRGSQKGVFFRVERRNNLSLDLGVKSQVIVRQKPGIPMKKRTTISRGGNESVQTGRGFRMRKKKKKRNLLERETPRGSSKGRAHKVSCDGGSIMIKG